MWENIKLYLPLSNKNYSKGFSENENVYNLDFKKYYVVKINYNEELKEVKTINSELMNEPFLLFKKADYPLTFMEKYIYNNQLLMYGFEKNTNNYQDKRMVDKYYDSFVDKVKVKKIIYLYNQKIDKEKQQSNYIAYNEMNDYEM